MGLFKKHKPIIEQPTGRRRPLQAGADQAERRGGAMFSYHSQRSQVQNNIGRRDLAEDVSISQPAGASYSRRRPMAVVLSLAIIIVIALLLTLTPEPKVELLQDKATAYFLQDASVYQQSAQRSLQSSLLNRNKLTVDTSTIRLNLMKSYPEIKNVTVSLPLFGTKPKVYVEPYKPSFILTTTSSNAFLLDATGRALASTSQIANIDKLEVPTLQDKTGNSIELGKRALPSTTVTFAQSVIAALKSKNVRTTSLTLLPAAYELDVTVTGKPYYIKFNLQNDPLQQAGTYLAVQQRLDADKITPAQYIDVRVADRAYYR